MHLTLISSRIYKGTLISKYKRANKNLMLDPNYECGLIAKVSEIEREAFA